MNNITWFMDSYGLFNIYNGSHSLDEIYNNGLTPSKVLKDESDILDFMKTHYKEGNFSFPILCEEHDVIEVECELVYGHQYEVTILDEVETVIYYGTRFSQRFNYGNGADVYLFERLDGSQFECLPKYVSEFKEVNEL